MEASRLGDEHLREIGEDAPVPALVGVGQGAPRDGATTEAHVVQLVGDGAQAGLDVAQALSIGELCEGQRQELIPAGEASGPAVASVTVNAPMEIVVWDQCHELSEDRFSLVHRPLLVRRSGEDEPKSGGVQIV